MSLRLTRCGSSRDTPPPPPLGGTVVSCLFALPAQTKTSPPYALREQPRSRENPRGRRRGRGSPRLGAGVLEPDHDAVARGRDERPRRGAHVVVGEFAMEKPLDSADLHRSAAPRHAIFTRDAGERDRRSIRTLSRSPHAGAADASGASRNSTPRRNYDQHLLAVAQALGRLAVGGARLQSACIASGGAPSTRPASWRTRCASSRSTKGPRPDLESRRSFHGGRTGSAPQRHAEARAVAPPRRRARVAHVRRRRRRRRRPRFGPARHARRVARRREARNRAISSALEPTARSRFRCRAIRRTRRTRPATSSAPHHDERTTETDDTIWAQRSSPLSVGPVGS